MGLQVSSSIYPCDGTVADTFLVSGNQLYHTAALLMLQKKPRSVATKSVSFVDFLRLCVANDGMLCRGQCSGMRVKFVPSLCRTLISR